MRSSNQYYLAAFIIAIVLIGAGIGAGYWLGQRGQNSSNQQSSQSASPSATPTQQASVTATPLVTVSPTPAKAATAACQTSVLKVAVGQSNGAAGSIYYPITFTNTSSTACTINGYPGVSLVNASGAQIGQPADRDTTKTAAAITLNPQANVTATLRVVSNNFDPGICKEGATQLKIYPPGNTVSTLITSPTAEWCPGLSITPVALQ